MRGQITPNPPFGSVTSNTILCFPLIFPSHASSDGSGDAAAVSAARLDGTELKPIAAAPAAKRPRKPRRAVLVSMIFDMGEPLASGHHWLSVSKVRMFHRGERG